MGYDTVAEAEQRYSPSQSVPSPPQSTHTKVDKAVKSPATSSSSDDEYWSMYGQQEEEGEEEEEGLGDAMDIDDIQNAFADQTTIKGRASPKLETDTKTITNEDDPSEDDYYAAYDKVETAVGGDEPEVKETPTEAHVIESIRSLKKLCESSGVSQSRFAELVKRGLTED